MEIDTVSDSSCPTDIDSTTTQPAPSVTVIAYVPELTAKGSIPPKSIL